MNNNLQRALLMMVALSVSVSVPFLPGPIRVDASQSGRSKTVPDLNGTWSTNDGEEVSIVHLLASGRVTATLKDGKCLYGDQRTFLFDEKLDGDTLRGKMNRCTKVEAIVKKCKKDSVYQVDFVTTDITKDRIKGTYKTEWYDPRTPTADDPCPYQRNPAKDRTEDFVLTRKEDTGCPDTAAVAHYKEVSERAASFIEYALKVVDDSRISRAMEKSAKALNEVSAHLSRYVKLGEYCEEVHAVIGEIRHLQEAIDEINKAKCGRDLARGFDHLFLYAGEIGSRFIKLPEVKPFIDLIYAAGNESFFTNMSNKLDPEQRWANQFKNIEGYVPNCPN